MAHKQRVEREVGVARKRKPGEGRKEPKMKDEEMTGQFQPLPRDFGIALIAQKTGNKKSLIRAYMEELEDLIMVQLKKVGSFQMPGVGTLSVK